jgi:hypothetical protein
MSAALSPFSSPTASILLQQAQAGSFIITTLGPEGIAVGAPTASDLVTVNPFGIPSSFVLNVDTSKTTFTTGKTVRAIVSLDLHGQAIDSASGAPYATYFDAWLLPTDPTKYDQLTPIVTNKAGFRVGALTVGWHDYIGFDWTVPAGITGSFNILLIYRGRPQLDSSLNKLAVLGGLSAIPWDGTGGTVSVTFPSGSNVQDLGVQTPQGGIPMRFYLLSLPNNGATFTASPKSGWTFVKWIGPGGITSTSNPLTVSSIPDAGYIIGVFKKL